MVGLLREQLVQVSARAVELPGLPARQRQPLEHDQALCVVRQRLALLAHDQWTFRNELAQARVWVDRYFDGRDKSVQTAQRSLKQLSAAEINIDLPNLNESLSAIKSFKLGKEPK